MNVALSCVRREIVEDHCHDCENCAFYAKYGQRTSRIWKNLVSLYCKGRMRSLCIRQQRIAQGLYCPDADVMPNGERVPHPFQALP